VKIELVTIKQSFKLPLFDEVLMILMEHMSFNELFTLVREDRYTHYINWGRPITSNATTADNQKPMVCFEVRLDDSARGEARVLSTGSNI
jgi:hypothetical protein